MKKTFLILGFIFTLIIGGLRVSAKTNQLHTITLEKNNGNYNIVLNTDSVTKVAKKVLSGNEVLIELSGVTPPETVNALYKGTESIDNLVIENAGFNKLKIYVSAQNIKDASVIMEPNTGAKTVVEDTFPLDKTIWSVFVLVVLGAIVKHSIERTNEDNSLLIKHDIKDREIALYKQYRQSIDEGISLSPKDAKMQNMLKKIDRKIDESLSMSLK